MWFAVASRRRRFAVVVVGLLAGVGVVGAGRRQPTATAGQPAVKSGFAPGPSVEVADGLWLFRPAATSLLDPPGPVVVQALRVDRSRARLAVALADGSTPARQPVTEIAKQHRALAAINASFFDMATGRQVGLLKVGGQLVATSGRTRGAVAWSDGAVLFDRVSVGLALRAAGRGRTFAIDHINPVESRSGLSLYTSAYRLPIHGRRSSPPSERVGNDARGAADVVPHAPADVPWARVWRWQLDASNVNLKVHPAAEGANVRSTAQRPEAPPGVESAWRVTTMLRDTTEPLSTAETGSMVLTYRSRTSTVPRALRGLTEGTSVEIVETYRTTDGTAPSAWERSTDAVAGAGLLVREGIAITEWGVEALRDGFVTERHPRTLIGTDAEGHVWLVTVDGRRPGVSVGMSFAELQRLTAALGLVNALNLDGGGSTTMVVDGEIQNHPTDLAGPRPVPDAIVVLPRTGVR